jgi:hypothetical protein
MGRRQVVALAWSASIASLILLALGVTGSMAGFTAAITNNANSAGTGSVVMVETSGGTTCYSNGATSSTSITTNTNNCAINKLGGNLTMLPGGTSSSVAVTISNSGTSPVNTAFTLTPGGCTSSANGSPAGSDASFCAVVDVAIWDSTDGKCIVPASAGTVQANCIPSSSNTLSSLGTTAINLRTTTGDIAVGGSRAFTILTQIDATNATNADMNLQAADNLTWTFTA